LKNVRTARCRAYGVHAQILCECGEWPGAGLGLPALASLLRRARFGLLNKTKVNNVDLTRFHVQRRNCIPHHFNLEKIHSIAYGLPLNHLKVLHFKHAPETNKSKMVRAINNILQPGGEVIGWKGPRKTPNGTAWRCNKTPSDKSR